MPGSARLLSFGQPMANHTHNALLGGRYQVYTSADYQGAMTGGIACDRFSRLAFYTQAPPPGVAGASPSQVWVMVVY